MKSRLTARAVLFVSAIFPSLLSVNSTVTAAQDQSAAPAAQTAADLAGPTGELLPDKLPDGEIKVLQAVVMEAKGTAEWRAGDQESWKAAKVDDLLSPGAQIRTGRASGLTLRVGHNATVMVSAMTRVDLPSIVQDGETLRTRASVIRGKADFKVDQVGLINDFRVLTASTTLAVRGTGFGVGWGGFEGAKVQALAGNAVRSIELQYFASRLTYFLSEKGASTETRKEPVHGALFNTVSPPAIYALGLETAQIAVDSGMLPHPTIDELMDVDQAYRNLQATIDYVNRFYVPPGIVDDFLDNFDLKASIAFAEMLCINLEFFDDTFFAARVDVSLMDNKNQPNYVAFMEALTGFCMDDMDDSADPLGDFMSFITAYCSTFEEQGQIDTCIFEAVAALTETDDHAGHKDEKKKH